MKHGRLFIFGVLISFLCGCGHNVYLEREITGLGVIVPIGDSALGVSIGSVKTVSATVRGGSSLETTSSVGGGIFSGSAAESRITTFKVNQQLNEGNLKEVLMSPEVPESVKTVIATNLTSAAKAPEFMPAVLQTDSATVHMGAESVQSNNVPAVVHHDSGIDKIVDTVPQITTPVINTVTDLTDKTIDGVNQTIDNAIDRTFDWSIATKWTMIIGSICAVLMVMIKKNSGDSSVSVPDLENIDPSVKKTADEIMKDESSSENIPKKTPDKKQPTVPNKEEKKSSTVSPPSLKGKKWWQKIIIIISGIVTLIGKIPPETRQKAVQLVKDWITRKRQEKADKRAAKK